MWGTSNWNQPGQQQPNQWPMPMQSDDLAIRAAEWAKQRLAMENQSQQQSMQGVHHQQHFSTGGTSSQMHPPTIPTSLGSATDVFPPPLMGQPYPASFTSQQPPGPSPPFGGGGKHEDKMDLDETRGGVSTVPPPLMGQQLVQGVHGLPQPDVAQYAPPQPPTPSNPPPTQSYINEPPGSHYAPSAGQTSASFQPLPPPGGSYVPQVESKPPLLATPPNTSYNPQVQVFTPETLYMQQGGQPFHQEQAYPGQGFISESVLHPASDLKKKTLPTWVKEGLVKMYKEKQKEEEKEAKLREMELTKRQSGGPRWSVDDDSESGGEGDKPAQDPPGEGTGDVDGSAQPRGILKKSDVSEATGPDPQHPEEEESDSDSNISYEGQTALSEEELLQKVRKMTIEILLEVTGDEMTVVASEVLQEMRGSQTNEKPASSGHTRTLLGIGAYKSDSSHSSGDDGGGSDDDDKNDQSLKLKKKALTNPYSNLPVPRDVDGSLRNDTIRKAFNSDKQEVPNKNETSLPQGRTQDESGAKLLLQTHPRIVHQTALQRDPSATVAGETKSNKSPPHRVSSGDSGSSSSSSEAGPSRTGHHRGRAGRKRSRTRSNSRGDRSTSRDRRSLSKEQERGGFLSHAKDRKRRSRSRSKDRKKRSRSRSKDRKRRSRSRSKDRKRRSRSRSKDRKRRSRSGSTDRKRRSRSRSKDRKRRSRSRSKDRKRRSRSRSRDRKRRSRSRSKDRKRRSRSRSKDRKRRSRSRSKDRWKRSRSRSMDRHRRSRSRSKDRHRRSQSRSRDRGRRSRSTSKDKRRRSRSRSKDRGKRSRSRSTDRQKHSTSWLKDTRSSRSRDTQGESHSKSSAEYMSSRRDQQLLSPTGSLSKSVAPSIVKGERDKASRDSKLGKHRNISSSSGSESEALESSSSSSSPSTSSSESSDDSSSGSIKKKKSKKEHFSKKSKPAKSTKKVPTRKKRSPSLDTSRSSSRVSGRKKVKHSPPLRDRTHGRDKNGSEPRSASKKKKH